MSFGGQTASAAADATGKWSVKLQPLKAGGGTIMAKLVLPQAEGKAAAT